MVRWFFLNARKRLEFAAAHPAYTLKALLREWTCADERFLARVTNTRAAETRRYLNEPATNPWFLDHLRRCETTIGEARVASADIYAKKILIQYAIVRALKPDIVLETGVANGVSTAYLLLALYENRKGSLHSIDAGDPSFLPPSKSPGWVVPDPLCQRWTLHIGEAKKVLPELLNQLRNVDIFIHDSAHTREHMMFEFEQAYPHLKPGGVLIADDALWNSAFADFSKAVEARHAKIVRGVGVLGKAAWRLQTI